MKKNIIIAEKDNQAELLAKALGLVQSSYEVRIPTPACTKVERKLAAVKKRIEANKATMLSIEQEMINAGKAFKPNKKYNLHAKKLAEYEAKAIALKQDITAEQAKQSVKSITYWEGDHDVLIACQGHLLEIKRAKKAKKVVKVEENEDEEDESDDDATPAADEETDLNFDIEYAMPSATSEDGQPKWLKLKLIEHVFAAVDTDRVYCATDYDREGQTIFGNLIEFYKIDFSKCVRMKFSTLEEDVLKNAYDHPIPFDMHLFESGKARAWSDFVIGFTLNPVFAKIYRRAITKYLASLGIDQAIIDTVKYNNTFNMGRVKLVILKYIADHTQTSVDDAFKVENNEIEEKETVSYMFYFKDDDDKDIHLLTRRDDDQDYIAKLDLDAPMKVRIGKITVEDKETGLPLKRPEKVPSFLNMTKTFEACKHLGASTLEINRILEYLYLQKYISYPRSKSERWEIDDDASKLDYARKVLDALKKCGYPVKDHYYETPGNEGSETHSHPCIHPLPSVDLKRVERLQKLNPLAFLVFNQIAIQTLECFEKLPVATVKTIAYSILQDNLPKCAFTAKYILDIKEANILDFEGYYDNDISEDVNVEEGDEADLDMKMIISRNERVSKNSLEVELLNDFEVIKFLNEENIGTDATRAPLLAELVEKKYLFSERVLLTTFLGNAMQLLAENYVDFIDIDYTRTIERYLDEIENGSLPTPRFVESIKQFIVRTYDDIMKHEPEIQEIFMDVPFCETHKTQMIIRAGTFGKYLICPLAFTEEKCNQRTSL